ncbi:MAG: Gfo/Idh/MocA family oxidoreductase, partial [Phycisphaerae bacterium]|nr:Gfo/Idh/MocA family oxidoreductase [Phycisphaerae bacterium]
IKADQTIRIGLIGAGGRGRDLIRSTFAWNQLNNVKFVALADPNGANIATMLESLEGWGCKDRPEVYNGENDWRDKILARTDIDAVLIATPCNMHAMMYLAAFVAGKHFYGEKPLCLTVQEADAIVQAQERNPEVKCQVGFQRRGSSWYQRAVQEIHNGMLGDLFEGRGGWRVSDPPGLPGSKTSAWLGRREHSGDWMLEQACHTWDVMHWVTKELPVAASGAGRNDLFKEIDPKRDVTDFYVAYLEYPSGMICDFEHNWLCPQFDDQWKFSGMYERFTGTNGSLALGEWPQDATYYPSKGTGKVIKLEEKFPDTTKEALRGYFQCLRDGSAVASNVQHGRAATLTGLLVRKAVYEKRRVEMKEILKPGLKLF